MGKITINAVDCMVTAKNCKIDGYNLAYLEDHYESEGFSFYNDYLENAAIMEWDETADPSVIAEARCDFESFLKPI